MEVTYVDARFFADLLNDGSCGGNRVIIHNDDGVSEQPIGSLFLKVCEQALQQAVPPVCADANADVHSGPRQ